MTCHRVVLSLGSNCDDPDDKVRRAIGELRGVLTDSRDSGSYSTRPLSGCGEDYVNAVMSGLYAGEPESLEMLCKKMECDFGRDETARRMRRVPLDIDIVMIDGYVVRPKDFNYDYFRIGYERISR